MGSMGNVVAPTALRGDLRYSRAFVAENKREGGYYKDYVFLPATLGVTFTFAR
jgi:hypothetical protein